MVTVTHVGNGKAYGEKYNIFRVILEDDRVVRIWDNRGLGRDELEDVARGDASTDKYTFIEPKLLKAGKR